MGVEEKEELLSNFLVDSWSYSKVSEFSRNEKSFEMSAIYGIRQKQSSSTIAGTAYHAALQKYFEKKKEGEVLDLPSLEVAAYDYIDDVKPWKWKVQKTTPTIEDCIKKANEVVTKLLRNFYSERSVYEDEIGEILDIEVYCDEYLMINGVDIPLTCHAVIDLPVRLKDGRIAIIDHKSKQSFTDEEELKMTSGRQAITYVKAYESKTGLQVDECWFVENKFSENRDKSPQLRAFKVMVDDVNTRMLYEELIYEPLQRMLKAVSDPDYVYMINDQDTFTDKAQIYEFWARTRIAEVDDFNVAPNKRDMVAKRLRKIRDASMASISPTVIKKFKENAAAFIAYDLTGKDMTEEEKIEHILRSFGVITKVAHKLDGISSNTYLLEVSAGVKISSVHSHKLDIANVLNVSNVRIPKNLVMHDTKSYLSIEFSKKREKDVLWNKKYLVDRKIPIGIDNFGNTIVWDLDNHSTPHVLMCGGTGSGKTSAIISIFEYAKLAKVKRIIIMDPKFDKDFAKYAGTKGIEIYNEIEDIEEAMEKEVEYMNNLVRSRKQELTMIIFDELADAVDNSKKGKELDIKELQVVSVNAQGKAKQAMVKIGEKKSLSENMKILLQKGRSSGYRIISATQRASTKVITGDAKVNLPVQVCFKVAKEVDSRVVLDEAGAESLAGYGDGLMRSPEYNDIVRFQAFYKPN